MQERRWKTSEPVRCGLEGQAAKVSEEEKGKDYYTSGKSKSFTLI